MPIPKAVATFNERVTNHLTGPFASHLPGFGVITHMGRRSGRTYRTPVNVFRRNDEYVVALTYGADAEWVRNVQSAGTCELRTRGHTVQLVEPRSLHRSEPRGCAGRRQGSPWRARRRRVPLAATCRRWRSQVGLASLKPDAWSRSANPAHDIRRSRQISR